MESTADYVATTLRVGSIVLVVLSAIVVVVPLFLLIRIAVNRRYLRTHSTVWLEIVPPASVFRTPEATEQLFSVVHGTKSTRSLKDRWLDRKPVMSFEITSTRHGGIRYFIQAEQKHIDMLQKSIVAYLPDVKVRQVKRTISEPDLVLEYKQTSHYVLPLNLMSKPERHDPLSYVTGAMSGLQNNEEITLQLVAIPVHLREAEILSHKILGNENILQQVNSKNSSIAGKVARVIGRVSSGVTGTASEVYAGITTNHRAAYNIRCQNYYQIPRKIIREDRPTRVLSAFELELMETMHQKVTKPLFQVSLRILIKSPQAKHYAGAIKSAIAGYSVPPYQALKPKLPLPILSTIRCHTAIARLPSLFRKSSIILASTELASLYHFPLSYANKTDNLVTSLSRTLPAPISLKNNQDFSVIIGVNHHHGITTPIGLTSAERERHQYIVGGTGSGKTTMLQYQIVQDMKNGRGLAVIDPHGDMAETILRHVPRERIKDVIYFNPDDLEYPIGLNLLELSPGLTDTELMREKDLITESVISVFRKIFSDEDSGGHRIEYILRNAIQTALTQDNATLFTVFDLLNDPKYRRRVIKTIEDSNLLNFWKNEFGKAGDMQKVKMAAGITAKIGRFLFSASARQVLEQPKSTINFDEIINSGKILICNVSKGLLGEDTSELFGITILAKLQLVSLRRARLQQSERRAFYIYVDEFQNFATTSFVQMLSESRKYKVFMIMAEQSTSQQSNQQTVNIILANVGTIVCFQTGNPQDEQRLLPMFSPYIESGEISNLPAYNYYVRLAAVNAQEPLSGETLLLETNGDDKVRNTVVTYSREHYSKKEEVSEVNNKTDNSSDTKAKRDQRRKRAVAEPMIDE